MSDVPTAPLSEEPAPPVRRSRRGFIAYAVVGVVGVVAAIVAGVGGSDGHRSETKIVTVAEIEQATRGTVRFHLIATAKGVPGLHAAFAVTGDGVADFDHNASITTITTPRGLIAHGAPTRQTELIVGSAIYLDAASLRKNLPSLAGAPDDPIAKALRSPKIKWIEMSELGKFLANGTQFATSGDPSDLVHSLEANGVHVTEIGMTTVDGVTATHYRATTTQRVPTPHQESSSNSFPLSRTLATTTTGARAATQTVHVVIDLWTDASNRLLRMTSTNTADGFNGSSTITETFRDYGGPAPIHAPPADEVFNFDSPGVAHNTSPTIRIVGPTPPPTSP